MKCLAIDTSGNHLTIALIDNDKVISSYRDNINLKHSVTLLPEIENLLCENNISLSEIDVYCAVIGPGSFTGIRIGVSTVKALAYANDKKVLSVTSFETIAYNKPNEKVLALIDAKHDHYYACGFDSGVISLPPCYVSKEELKTLSSDYIVIEDGVADKLNGLISAVKSKISLATTDRESIIPLYVKKSQAEEERK